MTTQPESNMRELGLEDLNRVSGGAIGPEIRSQHIVGPEIAGVRGVVGPEYAGRHIIGPDIAPVRGVVAPDI